MIHTLLHRGRSLAAGTLLIALPAWGAGGSLPPPATQWFDFPVPMSGDVPGAFAANALLPAPAGKDGFVTVKNGHFYSGERRVRFLGVNFAFAANFPTHDQADWIARRLARFGINIVRFHHMDSRPFSEGGAGIFADKSLSTLSPEALDRLDYLIAALKKNGVYADLNLHVSRTYPEAKALAGDAVPHESKMIDLFDPALIAAQKKYAHDLLTHVNRYTGNAYVDEPAVAMIEINNENTFFIWGGEQKLATLPAYYAKELQTLWNQWLVQRYGTREKLVAAWSVGLEPRGDDLLRDSALATIGKTATPWRIEQHEGAAMSLAPAAGGTGAELAITRVSNRPWHLQFEQAGVPIAKGRQYALTFRASATSAEGAPHTITVSISQSHDPWGNLGLSVPVTVTAEPKTFTLYFTGSASDEKGRLTFAVGDKLGTVSFQDVSLTPGGQQPLGAAEDPGESTVLTKSPAVPMTPARMHDWYEFLQEQDGKYFGDMYRYVKNDLHAHAPTTGTIGLGALGTMSQTQTDFIDAHAYWQHPQFPGRPWDPHNWRIQNTPLVDSPKLGDFPSLAAIRVAGKPFTVTEYMHPAPSDWRAECLPELATMAALQDWDAVFLFAYSHQLPYQRDHVENFFDIEGDPARMNLAPVAARLFLSGNVRPLPASEPVHIGREESLAHADRFFYTLWPQMEILNHLSPQVLLSKQLRNDLGGPLAVPKTNAMRNPLRWTSDGPATGQFHLNDPEAAVFIGFPRPGQRIALGPLTLSDIRSPYLVATLTPQSPLPTMPGFGVESSRQVPSAHLLFTVQGRTQNHDMGWNESRTSVGSRWGKGPTELETLHGTLTVPAHYVLTPLDPAGAPMGSGLTGSVDLSTLHAMWCRLDRAE